MIPIHRHCGSSETVVIIRGKIQWAFYDDNGNEIDRVTLDANDEPRMLNVERTAGMHRCALKGGGGSV